MGEGQTGLGDMGESPTGVSPVPTFPVLKEFTIQTPYFKNDDPSENA